MTDFILIDKEVASGKLGGVDYGSQVRLLVRTPDRLLIVGHGLSVIKRNEHMSAHDHKSLTFERCTKDVLARIHSRIEADFGAGIGDAVIRACRERKTVVIDGGGDKMPLPRKLWIEQSDAAYAAVTVNRSVPLTGVIPACKQCGADLQPRTNHHRMGFMIQPDHPRSLEDCQKRSNYQVVSVHDYGRNHPDKIGYVEWFETWDGETVWDPDFCGDKCAALYGRRAAQAGVELPVGELPVKVDWSPREDKAHYDVEADERRRSEATHAYFDKLHSKTK